MARLVWQFWNVGPFEDVRAELVMTYDDFEPNDIGRCGEPYAPNPACNKTFGLFIHGYTGVAVAGEARPSDPWSDASGIDIGARLEFRWSRFSFAITDFYGHAKLPYADPIFSYSRNVDPATGRPRKLEDPGRCKTGREEACLNGDEALTQHSVNQQIFHMICATSIGFSALDLAACGQTVLNSPNRTGDDPNVPATAPEPRVVVALNSVVAATRREHPARPRVLAGEEDSATSIARWPATSRPSAWPRRWCR
jgi:hypothetical protein